MTAPLYNRYRRYADREAKRFAKGSELRRLIPKWKTPNTRVYAVSEKASYEAGWYSTSEPGELMRAMSLHFLPTDQVWIEFDWRAYNKGSNHIAWDDPSTPLTVTSNGLQHVGEGHPVKVACLLYDPSVHHPQMWEPGTISGLLFYLYPSGACFVGPAFYGWTTDDKNTYADKTIERDGKAKGNPEDIGKLALSPFYQRKYRDKNPRLLRRLEERVFQSMLGHGANINYEDARETEGTTRMAIALLTAALSAKQADIDPNLTREPGKPQKRREGPPENRRAIEVDLFIRNRPKRPGGSIRASVGHMEGVKKGLHSVGAHWAYRSRRDGGDPTQCTYGKAHDFEDVEGTKTQVCILCGQKRWFRSAHERGDAAYGIVPQRTYNVRSGLPETPSKSGEKP